MPIGARARDLYEAPVDSGWTEFPARMLCLRSAKLTVRSILPPEEVCAVRVLVPASSR